MPTGLPLTKCGGYDTLTNSWAQKASVPDSLFGAFCFFINNKAYLCGGRDQNNQAKKTVWEYDVVADTWQQKGDMPDGGRWRASGGVINNKGYLVFGATSQTTFSSKLFEYDAGTDLWLQIDSFPGRGRTYAASGVVNGFLVVALGTDSTGTVYNDCYLYDVIAHQWINQNPLPSFGRKGCLAFCYNNSFYISAGIDGQSNRLTETWKADNLNDLKPYEGAYEIIAYPNPAKDVLYVEAENNASIELKNLAGETIFRVEKIDSKVQFSTQQLPAGMYFLQISHDSHFCSQKIIVQH
jgi:N-acetylneuraminic acid mutarotase